VVDAAAALRDKELRETNIASAVGFATGLAAIATAYVYPHSLSLQRDIRYWRQMAKGALPRCS
jgi:hypothetical protein